MNSQLNTLLVTTGIDRRIQDAAAARLARESRRPRPQTKPSVPKRPRLFGHAGGAGFGRGYYTAVAEQKSPAEVASTQLEGAIEKLLAARAARQLKPRRHH